MGQDSPTFFNDCLELSVTHKVTHRDVFRAYLIWCHQNNVIPKYETRSFGEAMRRKSLELNEKFICCKIHNGIAGYRGLKFKKSFIESLQSFDFSANELDKPEVVIGNQKTEKLPDNLNGQYESISTRPKTIGGSMYVLIPAPIKNSLNISPNTVLFVNFDGEKITYSETPEE